MSGLSAAFTVNSAPNPAEQIVAYSSTVNLALTSLVGVNVITWEILSCSKAGDSLPTITTGGSPLGATASFVMPSSPGDNLGRTFLVRCFVQSKGKDTAVAYGVVGAVNANGLLPICPGEELYRHATHGWSQAVNYALSVAGTSNATSLVGKTLDSSTFTTPNQYDHIEYDGTKWVSQKDLNFASGAVLNWAAGTTASLKIAGTAWLSSTAALSAFNQPISVTSSGAPVASTGFIRGPSATGTRLRNAANSGDHITIGTDGSDVMYVGNNQLHTALHIYGGTGSITFRPIDGNTRATVDTNGLTLAAAYQMNWASGTAALSIGGTNWLTSTTARTQIVNALSIGGNASQTDILGLPNATFIVVRNAANSADLALFGTDSSNNVYVGGDTGTGSLSLRGTTTVQLRAAATTVAIVRSDQVELQAGFLLDWASGTAHLSIANTDWMSSTASLTTVNSGALQVGTSGVATAGQVRLARGSLPLIATRNNAATNDIQLLTLSTDTIVVGGSGAGNGSIQFSVPTAFGFNFLVNSVDQCAISATDISLKFGGATVASAGTVRNAVNTFYDWRNNGNSANIAAFGVNTSDQVLVGDGTNNANVLLNASSSCSLQVGGTSYLTVSTSTLTLGMGTLSFASTVTPLIQQASTGTSDATGAIFSITPQAVTGAGTTITGATMFIRGGAANGGTATNKVGGPLLLRGGQGDASNPGAVKIQSSGGTDYFVTDEAASGGARVRVTTSCWLEIIKRQAVGGGATATLSTIGGSGPATAGQNEWCEIYVNGNKRWFPVWA
jgi:hypothetical protein